eukprot:3413904-Alexandrium_andersonii.AAC.1
MCIRDRTWSGGWLRKPERSGSATCGARSSATSRRPALQRRSYGGSEQHATGSALGPRWPGQCAA